MIIGGAATVLLGFMTSFYALLLCGVGFSLTVGKFRGKHYNLNGHRTLPKFTTPQQVKITLDRKE